MSTDHPASDLMSPAERAEAAMVPVPLPSHMQPRFVPAEPRETLADRVVDAQIIAAVGDGVSVVELVSAYPWRPPTPPADDRLSEAALCEIEARAAEWKNEDWAVTGGRQPSWHGQSTQVNALLSFPKEDVPALIDEVRAQRQVIYDLRDAIAGMHRMMHSHLGKDCP